LASNQKVRDSLADLNLPKTEFFQIDIGDGVALDAWAIHPPQLDRTEKGNYPLLVYVYGEPYGQTVKDSWDGKRGLWHRMIAQQGCVVVSVENRGTFSPRGRQWRKTANRKIGIIAPQEQAAATQQLLQQWPHLDPARVGIWGWSGGGSMSLNAIFRYPKLYHTAIAVAPNANQLLYDTIYQERYMGLPEENAENYHDGSPLNHASKLEGNLMLIHGTGDDNCHYQGTEYLINELIAHGKHFTVMPYPNRSHAIGEGENTVPHFWGLLARFLQNNLLDESSATRFDNRSIEVADEASADESNQGGTKEDAVDVDRIKRKILGWTIHIHPKLLADQPNDTKRALELLEQQLDEIVRVLPAKAVAQLRKVPLYFSPPYPGTSGGAEFHPSAQWLRENGRDPAMERAVEFTNIANFEAELDRMPNFALHELAHGYHCRSLPSGYENPEIKMAFERAKASGTYDSVERWSGTGKAKTLERAYAMSNPMEYFAECTEAFFSRNDFFPFNAEELKRHDPNMFELLGKLWGTKKSPSDSESK
jgi:dipeptidyl-peptidase 4